MFVYKFVPINCYVLDISASLENNTTFSAPYLFGLHSFHICYGGWWYKETNNNINGEFGRIGSSCDSPAETDITATKMMLRRIQ